MVLRRRLISVPAAFLLFGLLTAGLPLLLIVALIVDVVRCFARCRRFVSLRIVVFGWAYSGTQVLALLALGVTWLLSGFGLWRSAALAMTYRLQSWWAATLFAAVRLVFSLDLAVDGDDAVTPGPVLVFMRHASIADTMLPNALVTRRRGIKLRYVLKRELLADPALDIAGSRLINYFVDRRSDDSRLEIERVRELSDGLAEDEGVIIYPEGTRFTEAKRARVLERLRRRDPDLAVRAEQLEHVLPPQLGGSLALLDSLTPADVVIMAHVGLDGLAEVKDIWDGEMVGRTIRVAFWRIPFDEVPTDREGRVGWLFAQWKRVDEWIEEHRGE
jgi:1-acyl-sn-glycerol-3-phosphate acyltransferase